MEIMDGKVVFSRDYLRTIKLFLIKSESVSVYRGKCPACEAIVEFSEALTREMEIRENLVVPALDEPGWARGQCRACSSAFTVRVQNPDLTQFREGADKLGYEFDPTALAVAELPLISERINVEDKVAPRSYGYNISGLSLYVCEACGRDLDSAAFANLESKLPAISKAYWGYINWWIGKGHGPSPENTMIRTELLCECGRHLTSFFYCQFNEAAYIDPNATSLANIIGAKSLSRRIKPRVYTKDETMNFLDKLLVRWMLAFDSIYVVSPFVGHQYQDDEVLVTQWLEIVKRLDHRKAHLVTNANQLTKFKAAFEKVTKVSYDDMVALGLGSESINTMQRLKRSHAKMYCAVSDKHCELFIGSGNAVKGPSTEIMLLQQLDSAVDARADFLDRLGLKERSNGNSSGHSLLLDERVKFQVMGQSFIQAAQYWSTVMEDIEPGA